MNMKMDSFKLFMKSIQEDNMMQINAPINCPYWWGEYWKDVEKEVRENLAELPDNIVRVNYLENLLERLNRELNYYKSEKYEGKLKALYIDYNITEDEINTHTGSDKEQYQRRTNLLFIALRNSRRDLHSNGKWDDNFIYPRECYFGFHLFSILSMAIEFVNKKIEEVKYGYGWQNEKTTNLPTQQTKVVDENDNQNTEATTPISQQPELDSTGQSRLNDKGYDRTLPQATKTIVSFEYEYRAKNGDALKNLMEHLVKNDFLKAGTSIKDFKRIFYAVALDNSFNKVGWVGALNELRFFIHELIKCSFIKYKSKTHWAIVEALFALADIETKNLRLITKHHLRNSKEPKDENRKQLLLESLKILELNRNLP